MTTKTKVETLPAVKIGLDHAIKLASKLVDADKLETLPANQIGEQINIAVQIGDEVKQSQRSFILQCCAALVKVLKLPLTLNPVQFFEGRVDLPIDKPASLNQIATGKNKKDEPGLAVSKEIHPELVDDLSKEIGPELEKSGTPTPLIKAVTYPKWFLCTLYAELWNNAKAATRKNWQGVNQPEEPKKGNSRTSNGATTQHLSKREKDEFVQNALNAKSTLDSLAVKKAPISILSEIEEMGEDTIKTLTATLADNLTIAEIVYMAGRKVYDSLVEEANDDRRKSIIGKYAKLFKDACDTQEV